MNKSVKKNYIFNLIYQIFLLIIPIITTPYVSRVLLSDGVGKYSFSSSIVGYFSLIATFGFSYYAQREIAKHNGNKIEQSKVFWEIFILKIFTTLVSLFLFSIIIISGVLESYNTILLILMGSIICVALDSSFLLQGNEDFKKIVIVNFFVRIACIISVFIFVKNQSHLWIFTLINVISTLVSNVFLWLFSSKYLVKINIKNLEIKKHFMPALKLFIPTIAVSVYTLLDRTLIGIMMPDAVADSSVGYYESSEKIVKMALTLITSLGIVMLPNNTKYYSQQNHSKLNDNIYGAIRFTLCLGFPLMFGLVLISSNLVPWFFGPGFEPCIKIIAMLSPIVIVIGLSNVIGIQYLIPTGQDKVFTISILIGAIINLVLNLLTITKFGVLGAVVSTVIAEISVALYQIIYIKKVFSIKKIIKNSVKYFISSVIMFIFVVQVAYYLSASIINTFLLIILGVLIYFLLLIILRDEFVLNIIKKFFNKFKTLKNKKFVDNIENNDENID